MILTKSALISTLDGPPAMVCKAVAGLARKRITADTTLTGFNGAGSNFRRILKAYWGGNELGWLSALRVAGAEETERATHL